MSFCEIKGLELIVVKSQAQLHRQTDPKWTDC